MRTFGGNKAALHFRTTNKPKKHSDNSEDEPQKYRLEEGDGTSHAQQIVRELYHRYEKQLQRWKDYRNLFVFLGFVALFLATLYLQRNAHVAYKVHSTIESVVVPKDTTLQDTDEVYNWLQNLLEEVWKDPVCGDGICEAPFEFASYSRFGCRADCGKLSEIQNLTTIQVDIYYDFTHPVGSIPASELMQQSSWNLCPVDSSYADDCYFEDDIQFDRLSGEQHVTITDAPDGNWTLVVRRDIFNKIQGAVRDTEKVYAAGFYYKIYVAVKAARAEQKFEMDILQRGIDIANQTYFDYVNSTLYSAYASNTSNADYNYTRIRQALCQCGAIDMGNTTVYGDSALLALNNTVDPNDKSQVFQMLTYSTYAADPTYCPAAYTAAPTERTNYTDATSEVAVTNMTDFCQRWLDRTIFWRTNMTQSVQQLMIDRRLGDSVRTGKIASRNTVNTNLRTYLAKSIPELVDPIYKAPTGQLATEPISSSIDKLMDYYMLGITAQSQPLRAFGNITRRQVYSTTITMPSLIARAAARIAEVQGQMAEVDGIILPAPDTGYPVKTVGQLRTVFNDAGSTNTSLVSPNTTALADLRINYNKVVWQGNTTAYMVCDLPTRASSYQGTCRDMKASCSASINDTRPYDCTDLTDPLNVTIPGNLSDIDYRVKCEIPCDRKTDCNTICECYNTCGIQQYCECDACVAMNSNAAEDGQFVSIQSSVSTSAAASVTIADLSASGHRRRLLNTSNDDIKAQLDQVLSSMGGVKTQQDSIKTQMELLKNQVDLANQAANNRANDKTLLDLIAAGKAEIEKGQAVIEGKLDEILQKQQAANAAAEEAAAALSRIENLAKSQAEAQKNLESAVNQQLSAIRTATFQNIITLTQALALWKRARRDRALVLKATKLANVPCNSLPKEDNPFNLSNGNVVDNSTSRERNIGLTNRVIGGLMLHQTRTNQTLCPDSKFDKIQRTCTGPATIVSYGVDPVFKRGTQSYDPDFDDMNQTVVQRYYNCSLLPNPTYNVQFFNQTVNVAPFCAELYNPQELPYAFHFFPLEGKSDGFPVWFDINLSEQGAQTWYTYLSEGLYLDKNTRSVTAEIVTYNAPLRMFGYYHVRFHFNDGGSIKVKYRLHTTRVELYSSDSDQVRYAMEVILSMWICVLLLITIGQVIWTQRTQRNMLKFFKRGSNILDTVSNLLLFVTMIMWWVYTSEYAKKFMINLRYNVYQKMTPDANFLALADNGSGMVQANQHFYDLRNLIDMLNWYFALNGINILLLIARVLKLMDFQPRLGVVTRSLWVAGPDLIHFAIVAGMVFVGYSMMAHLIFGNAIENFASFGGSVNTCFEILLGNIDVNEDLRALGGLQSVAGALFFWTYELLVYMVLLNFLLAIIVDAFSEVKEKTHETVGIHTELYNLMRDKWRAVLGTCTSNYISDSKLGELLRQWAGEEGNQDPQDQAVQNAKKLLTIMNEELDEDTLRDIMLECLKDAPGDDANDPKAAAKQANLMSRCLPGGKGAPQVTSAEISQAARFIIDRFGEKPKAGDDGQEEEDADAGALESLGPSHKEAALEKERDQLAAALERLAEVQRELAEGQRSLMSGQKMLAEQQSKLVALMHSEQQQ